MSRRECVQLSLQVAALVFGLAGLARLPYGFLAAGDAELELLLLFPAIQIGLAAAAYLASGSIAARVCSDREGATALSARDGQALALGMVGAWTLVVPLQVLALALFATLLRRFLPEAWIDGAWRDWGSPLALASLAIRALAGLALLFGARGLARGWERLRRGSPSRPTRGAEQLALAEWFGRALAVLGLWLAVSGATEAVASAWEGRVTLDSRIVSGQTAQIVALVRLGLGCLLFACSWPIASLWERLRSGGGESTTAVSSAPPTHT